MEQIVCQHCGVIDDYRTEQAGPHIKAICNGCDKYIKFIKQSPAASIQNDTEFATDKQVNYIKALLNQKKIGSKVAGEIIKLLKGA